MWAGKRLANFERGRMRPNLETPGLCDSDYDLVLWFAGALLCLLFIVRPRGPRREGGMTCMALSTWYLMTLQGHVSDYNSRLLEHWHGRGTVMGQKSEDPVESAVFVLV